MRYNFYAGFTIVAFIFAAAILIVFLTKKNINSVESKLFKSLLFITFLSISIEIYVQNLMILVNLPDYANDTINRLAFIINEAYCALLAIYCSLKCVHYNKEHIEKVKVLNKEILVFGLAIIGSMIPINLLPINYYYNEAQTAVLYVDGPSVNIAFVMAGIFLFLALIDIGYLHMKRTKVFSFKKTFWNAFVIIIGFVLLCLQGYNQLFTVCQFCQLYFVALIYFNIENPDIKLAQEVKEAKMYAEEVNNSKSNFLSNMSHEIRTPLNAIIGLSKNLIDNENVPKVVVDDVNDIVMASNNLLEIIGNIIDINKMESEVTELRETKYNFKSELQTLIKVLGSKIDKKPIALGVMVDPIIPEELIGDKYCVKTILNNLLDNAIKFTEKGQITVTMKLLEKNDQTCKILLSISDTGKGIKQDDMPFLFNRFEKVSFENQNNSEQSGLGLSLVDKLVKLIGGTITVHSQYGEGSTFEVVFTQKLCTEETMKALSNEEKNDNKNVVLEAVPVEEKQIVTPTVNMEVEPSKEEIEAEAEHINEVQTNEVKQEVTEQNTSANLRMLIVDDNKINIKVAKKNVDGLGFEIDECENGALAVDKVKAGNKYDIILMDIMMPVMDGEEAIRTLKSLDGFNTPVIAVTADAIAGAREKYLSEGFIDYVSKPFTKEQIKNAIEKALESVQ